jgi:hypothetical protein
VLLASAWKFYEPGQFDRAPTLSAIAAFICGVLAFSGVIALVFNWIASGK